MGTTASEESATEVGSPNSPGHTDRTLTIAATPGLAEGELDEEASPESAMEPLAAPVEEIVSATANYKEGVRSQEEATEEEGRREEGESRETQRAKDHELGNVVAAPAHVEGIEVADSLQQGQEEKLTEA